MLGFLLKLIPADYRVKVAAKYVASWTGKAVVSLIAGSVLKDKLSHEHVEAVGVAVTLMTGAGLTALQDWAKVKWPEKTEWLGR
jgi:hypothetical protein